MKPKTKLFALTLLTSLSASSGRDAQAETSSSKPDIVVFMIDDLDMRLYDDMLDDGLLPNIERHIVERGTNFRRSYATDAICCPSRATFLSGQYVQNHGVKDVTTGYGHIYPVDATGQGGDATFLQAWLKAAGYRTALIGKYMNEYDDHDGDGVPEPAKPADWDHWVALFGGNSYNMNFYTYIKNGQVSPAFRNRQFQTDFIADETSQFIEASSGDAPLFLYVAPTAPHTLGAGAPAGLPYDIFYAVGLPEHPRYPISQIPDMDIGPAFREWIDSGLADKPSWLTGNVPPYRSSLHDEINEYHKQRVSNMRGIDDLVGQVVASLQTTGRYDSSLFVFVSDNGFFMGEHGLTQKSAPYEEAIHVPLTIAGPGIRAEVQSDALVANTDLSVTIADFAGATPLRQVDGRSLRPVLQSSNPSWTRQRILIENYTEQTGVVPLDVVEPYRAIRVCGGRDDLIFVDYEGSEIEMYDLAVDPFQLDNAARQLSEVAKGELQLQLRRFDQCSGRSCVAAEDR